MSCTHRTAGIYAPILVFALIIALLSSCGEPLPQRNSTLIQSAHWEPTSGTLHLEGHGKLDGSRVELYNKASGDLIATTLIRDAHFWEIDLQYLDTVPCAVLAINQGESISRKIDNAPSSCNTSRSGDQRQILQNVAPANIQILANNLPDTVITSPANDITISAGSGVYFGALGSSITPEPLNFQWSFDGAVADENIQNPGSITFTKPGVYRVSVTASNLNGSDPSPAMRTITVLPVSSNILAAPPIANIDSPPAPVTIMTGEAVFFAGSAFDPSGSTQLTFLWNFGGAAPNSTLQNPGPVIFNTAGSFVVTLTVFDELGNRNIEPATVTINVVASTFANQPPDGTITGPNTDVVIVAGSGLYFSGSGFDPDGNEPLTYFWDFGGGATPVVQQNPGFVLFATPGIFPVTLTVFDTAGMADPTPDFKLVTVLGASLNNNDLPDGMILTPDADVTINVGDTLSFTASGNSPTGNVPLSYLWDFGDPAIPPSMDQNPMPVTYETPGVFTVQMTVTDSLGQADASPALLMVTVMDAAAPPSEGPEGEIASPSGDVTIEAGMAVDFQGDGDDAAGNHPITFLWNFGDPSIPDSIEQNPGPIVFAMPGTYTVTLTATDSAGNVDPTPAQVVINVLAPGTVPADPPPADTPPDTPPADPAPADPTPLADAPEGMILSPAGDITILVGDTIEIAGAGSDPNGSPLSFYWDIDGGPGDSTAPIPGNATFTMEGVWDIELTVTNAEGITDPTPEKVMITVLSAEAPPP